MKNLFAVLAFVLAFSFAASAQRILDINVSNDTLTNLVTKSYTTSPVTLDVPYYYSIHVLADSLSGGLAGCKAYLQVCNDRTGTNWYTLQTLNVRGTAPATLWEGLCYARRIRVYWDMPSGTRKVRAKVFATFKRAFAN